MTITVKGDAYSIIRFWFINIRTKKTTFSYSFPVSDATYSTKIVSGVTATFSTNGADIDAALSLGPIELWSSKIGSVGGSKAFHIEPIKGDVIEGTISVS